ncbi:PREDICTED: uncharacterized protein LOC109129168 [Camelina sativa]|uniref:Uncharacterized protein LOC109129168 n=1 Tax=Camelina sativa TaxID=90675 RepID=A0ABM1R029_CAMSA|nr:PREDICTED: uncharacterized protein LOC109129168 [Camelina sativa]
MGPPPENSQYSTVADLICSSTMTWNPERLESMLPEYKDDIMAIRPSKHGAENRYIWLLTKSGDYTAKSGYHTLSLKQDQQAQQENMYQDFNWEKEIWTLLCLPKIRFFLWKLLRNALPTGENLVSRGINQAATSLSVATRRLVSTCFFTVLLPGMFGCDTNKNPLDPSMIKSLDMGLKTAQLLVCLPPTGIAIGALGAWILWSIWTCRNKLIFEQRSISPKKAMTQAITQTREWYLSQTLENPMTHTCANRQRLEETPDLIRCFTDAAWREESQDAGFGWIFKGFPLHS